MQFHLTKNESPPKGQFLLEQPEGVVIAYEEPLRAQLFRKLGKAINETKWPRQFWGKNYRLTSNSGFLEISVPAAEYYKISFRGMTQKYHGIMLLHESIVTSINDISSNFSQNRKETTDNKQPIIKFNHELYDLRSSVSSYLFLIRSLLDQFAALIQFLSGPKANQYSSFSDVVSKSARTPPPPELDPELCDYLTKNTDWYWKLKDFRDFIAHHGFVPFRLVEPVSGKIEFYVHYRISLLKLIDEFRIGLDQLLSHLDRHFAERIYKNA